MKLISYGKINMFLNIVGKRKNGYHDIETLIQRIDLFDEIELSVDKHFMGIDIEISCNNEDIPVDDRNLCYKSTKWFMKRYNLNGKVRIYIHKNIPMCAGLGGGTSNGAEIIKGLNKIYNLGISTQTLCKESILLGADFPYSIIGGTVLCEGIGDKVTPIKPLDSNIILIVKPDFGFSTNEVYENFNIKYMRYNINKKNFIDFINTGDIYAICKNVSNTLEYSSIGLMDIIRDIKLRFIENGAIGSTMSGSGSSVYGIFDNLYRAQMCYEEFKKDFKSVFLTRTIDK